MKFTVAFLFLSIVSMSGVSADISLETVLNSNHRVESANRDQYRNPLQTLQFFDVQPNMTVVEIWPGNKGWYTDILAPYLKDNGQFIAAQFDAESTLAFFRDARAEFVDHVSSHPEVYGQITVTTFNPPTKLAIAPADSVDRVLTFRNVHNWYMRGGGDEKVLAAFKAFYSALKPGGILGVVDHRLPQARAIEEQNNSGYMKQSYVVAMAVKAGFAFLASSSINGNVKDTASHPKGVWTLPPSLRLGDEDRELYKAIGESDRMTLKFIKPQ
jgi:predicted methyltransferase